MTSPVNATTEGSVGIIELARPEKFNCRSLEVHERICARARNWRRAGRSARSSSRTGKHFCTGADLTEVKAS